MVEKDMVTLMLMMMAMMVVGDIVFIPPSIIAITMMITAACRHDNHNI